MQDSGFALGVESEKWLELAKTALVAVASAKYTKKRKHGHRRDLFGKETPTHRVWRCMKDRCLNKNHMAYTRYGGRGITVCARWLVFDSFLADMGERPEGATIDRVNNDQGYSPENCRWATRSQQQRNTQLTRHVFHSGERMSVAEAAELVGINRYLVYKRLDMGWPVEKALSLVDHRSRNGRLAVG